MFSRSDRLFTTKRGRGNDETESQEKQRSWPGISFKDEVHKCPKKKYVPHRLNALLKYSTRT